MHRISEAELAELWAALSKESAHTIDTDQPQVIQRPPPAEATQPCVVDDGATAHVPPALGHNPFEVCVGQTGRGALHIGAEGAVSGIFGYVGAQAGSKGAVTVDGAGQWTNAASLYVGEQGEGSLRVQNGGAVVANSLYVGYMGAGTLHIESGGAVITHLNASLGRYAGGQGAAVVQGAGSRWANDGVLSVGLLGRGTLAIRAGGVVSAEYGHIGAALNGWGQVIVSGAGSLWKNTARLGGDALYVGENGAGTLTLQDGGAASAAGRVIVGGGAGARGAIHIGAAPGEPPQPPGTLHAQTVVLGSQNGRGALVFKHTDACYVFSPRIVTGAAVLDSLGANTSIVMQIAGTTVLTARNSYRGATAVHAGVLQAGAADVLSPQSEITVAAEGTLDLDGYPQTVQALSNAGTVRLGCAPGTLLTATDGYTGGGAIAMELRGSGGATGKLLITGGAVTGVTRLKIALESGANAAGEGILLVDAQAATVEPDAGFELADGTPAGHPCILARTGNRWYLRACAA